MIPTERDAATGGYHEVLDARLPAGRLLAVMASEISSLNTNGLLRVLLTCHFERLPSILMMAASSGIAGLSLLGWL
jgi:hypothetical protein